MGIKIPKTKLRNTFQIKKDFTDLKRKQLRIVLLILLSIFAYTTWIINAQKTELSNEDFIRFHVIANSDSKEDQSLKLLVRDKVLEKVNQDLIQEVVQNGSIEEQKATLELDEARAYIETHIDEIEVIAEQCIADNGYTYPVDAELGVRWIPEKKYGTITFPAGNYEALNLVIGEGDGQNWWCVLFPPFCLIDAEPAEKASAKEQLTQQELYQDALLDEKYSQLLESQGKATTLHLKFKTLELMEKYN